MTRGGCVLLNLHLQSGHLADASVQSDLIIHTYIHTLMAVAATQGAEQHI